MKNTAWWVAGAMLVLVAIQEGRIQALRKQLGDPAVQESSAGGRSLPKPGDPAGEPPGGPSPRLADRPQAGPDGPDGEPAASEMGRTLRKMSENPVGQAMMSQGIKAMAEVWYRDLVDEFALNDEEAEYFLGLQASMFAGQQQLGMKMMGAGDAAERQSIVAEIEAMKDEHREAVKTFLNHDEDFATFEAYEERMPERQQLEGVRSSLASSGTPLREDQEAGLVEALYQARKAQASATDWNGAEGMEAIARGDATERFEREWEEGSRRALEGVGEVLDAGQLAAFESYLEQMREMQMMGMKMAEKMFQPDEADGGE